LSGWFWRGIQLLGGFALAWAAAGTWKLALGGLLGCLVAYLFLLAWAEFLFFIAQKLRPRLGYRLRIVLGVFQQKRDAARAAFLSVGLAIFAGTLTPQLYGLLNEELSPPAGTELPDLFLFDIQEEQVPALKNAVEEEKATMQALSPMIRARLLAVNGVSTTSDSAKNASNNDYESDSNDSANHSAKTSQQNGYNQREQTGDVNRNRGYNLSSRLTLGLGERLVAGKMWTAPSTDFNQAEASVEALFAKRAGWKLGDSITFDVQGIPLGVRITSLRRVRWTTFQPNFFVLVQPGVLDDAPKSFIASVKTQPDKIQALQDRVAKVLPNATALDVGEALAHAGSLLAKVASLVGTLAGFSFALATLLLLVVAEGMASDARPTTLLCRALGEPASKSRRSWSLALATLCGLAGLGGGLLSFIAAQAIAMLWWDLPFNPNWAWPLAATLLCALFGAAAGAWSGRIAAHHPLRELLNHLP
jgi:putative ABC transport system permease protein